MKRLIWKEWREKRMWLLVFFAFVAVALAVFQDGLSFGGRIETSSPWVLVLLLPALLLGLNTFSRETGYECQDFLFARPIGWKQILGAKLLVDCVVMLGSILACAVLYRLLLPPDYGPLADVRQTAAGVGITFAVAVMGYLPGFGASVVLPGLLGGGIVLCMVGIAAGTEAVYIVQAGKNAWIGLLASWAIAIIAASVLMARRGLSLTATERAKKYGIYVVAISTVMLVWAVPVGNRLNLGPSGNNMATDISPDGRFMLEFPYGPRDRYGSVRNGAAFLVRRSDGATRQIDLPRRSLSDLHVGYGWSSPNWLVLLPWNSSPESGCHLVALRMDDSGRIVRRETPDLQTYYSGTQFSPDGRYAILTGAGDSRWMSWGRRICIVDVSTMKPIFLRDLPDVKLLRGRWESKGAYRLRGIQRTGGGELLYQPLLRISPDGTVTMETPNWQVVPKRPPPTIPQ